MKTSAYQPDILGKDFEQLKISLLPDQDGEVICTLVRKKAEYTTTRAVLYIHGFIDYFFQEEMALAFNQQGYDFYALDLRKYGRSHLAHQNFYEIVDLDSYDEDLLAAIQQIKQENHDEIVLAGHSTGGLITTLFSTHHPEETTIKALWLNSPFFDFNAMHPLEKKYVLPKLSQLGAKYPRLKIPSRLNPFYVKSLHQKFDGEWNFNLDWKPVHYSWVKLGFVHAIYEAHRELHQGPKIPHPTLIMHSNRSSLPKKMNNDVHSSDVILDVEHIVHWGKNLKGDIQLLAIPNGLHDLVLSNSEARTHVYDALFAWLHHYLP